MPEGGKLTVGVVAAEPNGIVELLVTDSGPGLDPGVRRRLFEPYFSTKSSGTGLGLAIVRRAVEAHGGTIEVTSEPERGTTFRINIPQHS
jgi:signal transduction histidine kinase